MKNYLLFCFMGVFFIACTNNEKAFTHKNQPNSVYSFNVKGMTCPGCENTIITEVEKLPGIDSAGADFNTGTTLVVFDSMATTKKDIIRAIEKKGYHVISGIPINDR